MDNNEVNVEESEEMENETPKKKKEKKPRKPVSFGGIVKGIFIGLLVTVIGLCVAVVSVMHFKFQINTFSLVKNVIVVNKQVKTEDILTNTFSESDYTSLTEKMENFGVSENALLLSDKEIAGYIDHSIKSDLENDKIKENFNGILEKATLTFEQLDFYNISKKSSDARLSDVNIVVKLDITKLKEENLNTFPKNLIAKMIPNELYFSIDFEILRDLKEGEIYSENYKVQFKSIKINNLKDKDSKEFLDDINNFVKIGSSEELCEKVGSVVADTMIGSAENKGLYFSLKDTFAKSYSFYSDGTNDNFIIYNKEATQTASVTYSNVKTATNDNKTTFTVLDNEITLKDISANGYNFLGWYNGADENADKITSFTTWDLQNKTIYARWELIEYKIEYVLRGGSLPTGKTNPTTYTIEDVITLVNLSKIVETPDETINVPFLGWTGSNGNTPMLNLKIENKYGDLKFYAKFEDDERSLFVYVGDTLVGETITVLNETIDKNVVDELSQDYIDANFSGYVADKWYTDANLTKEFDFNTKVVDDGYLYCNLKYMVETLCFYPYISKFETAIKEKKIELNSRAEFRAYFEYISFYLVTDEILLKLNYLDDYSKFETELNEIQKGLNVNFMPYYEVTYAVFGLKGLGGVKMSILPTFWNKGESLISIDAGKTQTNKQKDYAFALPSNSTRTDDFDDFKIDKTIKTMKVTHSWQLAYCLEQGYRPICTPGSGAESIYNKAKAVLREICDDSMNDFEKTHAIYEWLILNVNYDQKALQIAEQNNYASSKLSQYDSWYAEGVFNTGVAVCEGYAKAFLIMARIEGIPMIYVTGNQHAWNKVYINGNWYSVDATHGDTQQNLDKVEIFNNFNFLVTDEYKSSKGYTSVEYTEFKATTVYNYYKNAKFTIDGVTFDLHTDTNSETLTLIKKLKYYTDSKKLKSFTFELELGKQLSIQSVINVICSVYKLEGVPCYNEVSVDGYSIYTFTINLA